MIAAIVWDVDPILLKLGSLELRWYGLMWGLGFILAYELVSRLFKKEGYPEAWADKLFIWSLVSTVLGARLGHCLFYEWDYYSQNLAEILMIHKGGLASHGGVFAIITALMLYSKLVTKKSVWWLFDRMIPAVAAVCFCIRFGNLMNSEIFGYPTTLPWGFEFVRSHEWQKLYAGQACHPTQIYEMIYCAVAFVVSWVMYHKFSLQKHIGLITGVSLLIFFGSRFALEFMKNPQVAEEIGMTINIGQWLSVPLILLGLYLIFTSKKNIDTDFKSKKIG
ncbi:MAG: prolipoprotein diacylglyceryl transferase [Phocaeicola sp.]